MTRHFTFDSRAYFTWCCWFPLDQLDEDDSVTHTWEKATCEGLTREACLAFTQDEYEAARANDWAPWGTEEQWVNIRRAVRAQVAWAPPIDPGDRHKLAMIFRPRPGQA